MRIIVKGIDELPAAAAEFVRTIGGRRHFAFRGEMGAGKTTFIAEICKALGVGEIANSPSFSIANEYEASPSGRIIYHFDFYRLESPAEALEIGVEDYFESDCLCLMEWPDMIGNLLPEDTVDVVITVDDSTGYRIIEISE